MNIVEMWTPIVKTCCTQAVGKHSSVRAAPTPARDRETSDISYKRTEQQRTTYERSQQELELIKNREVEEARLALKGSVQALESQLSEIQRQLQVEREARAESERNHTQEMETAKNRYEEAKKRHEATIEEHLQAEELLWKDKES